MITTLDIDEFLVAKAKSLAAAEHTTLTRLVEEGLALRLRAQVGAVPRSGKPLAVFAGEGGLTPGVFDPASHRALLDAADERDDAQ